MRVTITLDDEAMALAKRYAKARDLTLGNAINELIRRATRKPVGIKCVDGLPVFDSPKSKRQITTSLVKAFELEEPLTRSERIGLGTKISSRFAKGGPSSKIRELRGGRLERVKFE
jgi:hypothetical protein